MVVRIHNIGKWSLLKGGDVLHLPGKDRRKVRLEVNCPAPTRVYSVEGTEGSTESMAFLAVVQGHEVVEFTTRGGDLHIACLSDDDVFYFTNDGDQIAVERPEAVSFTKIASRRARNPEMERMMWKMEQNMTRRMEAQRVELEAMAASIAARQAELGGDGEDGSGAGDGGEGGAAGEAEGAADPAGQGADGGSAT